MSERKRPAPLSEEEIAMRKDRVAELLATALLRLLKKEQEEREEVHAKAA